MTQSYALARFAAQLWPPITYFNDGFCLGYYLITLNFLIMAAVVAKIGVTKKSTLKLSAAKVFLDEQKPWQ